MNAIWPKQVEQIVDAALAEDIGSGDATTEALIPANLKGKASLIVKEEGILVGMEIVAMVFHRSDPSLMVEELIHNGARVHPGDIVATIHGMVVSLLRAERVALNFLQQLSGIATETSRYVAAVAGLDVRIIDTRKTSPGLRLLQKYAVRVGGGHNHRQNLSDGILIKDNHLAAVRALGVELGEAIKRARHNARHPMKIEVEVETVDQARQAIEAGADAILLDNMSVEDMRRAVELIRGRALIEASGGITLSNVRAVAETGVNLISVGALTYASRPLNISLELEPSSD